MNNFLVAFSREVEQVGHELNRMKWYWRLAAIILAFVLFLTVFVAVAVKP